MAGGDRKFDLQRLSQCGGMYNCLIRSVPEIYQHVAGTLSSQPPPTPLQCIVCRRWMWSTLEDWPLLGVRSIQAIAMSVMLGVVYWQLTPNQAALRDHFGVLYMVSIMYPYLIIMDVIETCKCACDAQVEHGKNKPGVFQKY